MSEGTVGNSLSLTALNTNWLNADNTSEMLWSGNGGMANATITGTAVGCTCSGWSCTGACRSTAYYTWWPYQVEGRKIRLKLSEVDVLRKAAKADDKLRAVLKKMTPHIEVEVDL